MHRPAQLNQPKKPQTLPSFKLVFRKHLRTPIHRFSSPRVSSPLRDYSRRMSPQNSISSRRGLCNHANCPKRARKGGLCVSHGGGRRCQEDGCVKSVQTGGIPDRCFAHGGGKRCADENCTRGSVRQGFCRYHLQN